MHRLVFPFTLTLFAAGANPVTGAELLLLEGGNISVRGFSYDGSVATGYHQIDGRGVVISRDGEIQAIDPLRTHNRTEVPGVNNAGDVFAVRSEIRNFGSVGAMASRLDAFSGLQPLDMPDDMVRSHSFGISGDGSTVVGGADTTRDNDTGHRTAVVWNSEGTSFVLSPFVGYERSSAADASSMVPESSGQVTHA